MKRKDVEKWAPRQVVGLGKRLSATFGLLVGALTTPRQVAPWYGRRMRIEESFRDGKNERWGRGAA